MCDVQSAPPTFLKLSGGSQFLPAPQNIQKSPVFLETLCRNFSVFTKVYGPASNAKLIFHAIAGESIQRI